MKRLILAAVLLPATLVMMAFFAPAVATRVKFSSSDWTAAKDQATKEKKLYFVDFDASYCASCRNMDESTYQDMTLASYIEQNVVALRLDVQDFDGVMWSQKYEVEALPTMLIFDEQGKLVKRLVGYKSAKDLLQAFAEARSGAKITPSAPVATTSTTTTTVAPAKEDQPMLKPSLSTRPNSSNDTKVASTSISTNTPPSNFGKEDNAATGLGLYEIKVSKAASADYTVQVGVFSTYEALLEQTTLASSRFNSHKTMMHIDQMNGQIVYKLLVGTFSSKRDATAFRETLRNNGMDGLVKSLASMK